MNLRTSILIIFVALLHGSAPSASGKKSSFRGRIAATRPADAMQVASFATNQELFLFRTNDAKWLKLVYRHQGYSDIRGDVLSGAHDISISVRRDTSCDQTIGAFEKEAPVVPLQGDGSRSSTEPVVFSSGVPRPPESYKMKCYALERWSPVNPVTSSGNGGIALTR